jgi:hypothetical protein
LSLISYSDICYESSTLRMEVEGLTDDALIDECNHIMVGLDGTEMEELLALYFKNGELTKEQRKKAEELYVLAYVDLAWED